MEKIELKKGGYFCISTEPGIPFKLIDVAENGYIVSMLLKYKMSFS